MKIYNLIHEQDTDAAWGCDVRSFTDKLSAQNAMRESWESTVKAWEYDAKEHKDEDECECCESTAVIRDDSDVESWRIEEQELDVQIAVRVKGGLVEEVHANADVSVEVYDLDVSSYPKRAKKMRLTRKGRSWRNWSTPLAGEACGKGGMK